MVSFLFTTTFLTTLLLTITPSTSTPLYCRKQNTALASTLR